jgi:hypothetical protein
MDKIERLTVTGNSISKILQLFCLTAFCLSFSVADLRAEGPSARNYQGDENSLTGSGLARITDSDNSRKESSGIDQAKTNALLSIRKVIYETVATDSELLGIFLIKNSSVEPLINNLLENVTFSKPSSIIPDLIEIEATISCLDLQKLIAPVLLGKDTSNIELSTNELTTIDKESHNIGSTSELTVVTPEGSNCSRAFFPTISSHDKKLAGELRQKLANFVVDGGKLLYKRRAHYKEQSTKDSYVADSTGGIKNSTIYLTDMDSTRLITTVTNIEKPDESKIVIIID